MHIMRMNDLLCIIILLDLRITCWIVLLCIVVDSTRNVCTIWIYRYLKRQLWYYCRFKVIESI